MLLIGFPLLEVKTHMIKNSVFFGSKDYFSGVLEGEDVNCAIDDICSEALSPP